MERIIPAERHAVTRTAVRFVIAALLTVVAAGSWDVWWHGAVGRDTFWEPPHVLLQVGVAVTVVAAAAGWWRTRDRRWGWLLAAALLVPLSAPFDELWHRAFGVEGAHSWSGVLPT